MSLTVVIDTDPGIDDAMAILLALSFERLNVVGLTIVHGNLGSDSMTQLGDNARRVLRLAKRSDVPVVLGLDRAIQLDAHKGAPFVHGDDGLGCVPLQPYEEKVENNREIAEGEKAPEFLVRLSKQAETLHIISLGPMSNLAAAQQLDSSFGSRVKLFAMGGCFLFPGNVSTNAEANIWNDPFAANLVFSTFSSVHLAPLDVTCSIRWGSEFLAKLKVRAPILGDFIEKIAKKYIEFHDHILGIPVCDFHDSCAVIALVAPHLFTLQELHWVRVETSNGFCRGVCVADFRNSKENPVDLPKTVTLLREADSEKVLQFYSDQIAMLDQKLYSHGR